MQLKEGTVVQDRLEVNVTAEPHSYVAGSMVHHDLYSRGISPFIQPLDVSVKIISIIKIRSLFCDVPDRRSNVFS